jgi:hypothetical protein
MNANEKNGRPFFVLFSGEVLAILTSNFQIRVSITTFAAKTGIRHFLIGMLLFSCLPVFHSSTVLRIYPEIKN